MREFEVLFGHMDRLVERVFDKKHLGYLQMGSIAPPMDVYETEGAIVILMELPGISLEDVNVTEHEGILTIEGVRRDPSPKGRIRCHQLELAQGKFQRQVHVGQEADNERIEAKLKDGLLTVKVPKEQP